jgi:hypothetical protein
MRTSRRPIGSPKIRSAYAFLAEAEQTGRVFTRDELVAASGWTEKTTKANLSKKLNQIVVRTDGGYQCVGAIELGEEGFCRVCSQNSTLAADPRRPGLTPKTEELVLKARESVLAAVQHYNNPTALFRSGNYLVLMIIGFTALFHACFERDGVDYIEYTKDGKPKLTKDGQPYHWDVLRSARVYVQQQIGMYDRAFLGAVEKNLEFVLPIRHMVEHRHMPQLDLNIGGHCQSLLFNFERILINEFSRYYALNLSLSLALQFSTERSSETVLSLRRFQSAEYEAIQEHIARFHAHLPDEIASSTNFEFRVWLVQKPANRERSADRSIEFVSRDQLSDQQYADLQRSIIAIKAVPEDPSKICQFYERDVLQEVTTVIGKEVLFGTERRVLNGSMIREVREAHNIQTPSRMYYRPEREGSRAYYGPEFVQWIIQQYDADADFFYKARQTLRARKNYDQ